MRLETVKLDRALAHFPAFGMKKIGNRFESCRLAGAIRAKQRNDAAARNFERDTLQHENHMVVNDLDIVDRKNSVVRNRRRGCRVHEPFPRKFVRGQTSQIECLAPSAYVLLLGSELTTTCRKAQSASANPCSFRRSPSQPLPNAGERHPS